MDNRIKYWNNDYTKYWLSKVNEANNKTIKNKIKTSSDKFYNSSIELLNIKKNEKVLEMGVGFGRSIIFLSKLTKDLYALDISESMIEEAKKTKIENVKFFVCESENTNFNKNYFDKIICFASFDAMYQNKALLEINRILKVGGKVILTGKNDNYFDNDLEALDAEIGARKKGHPNFFTNCDKLIRDISKFGFKIDINHFYLRRGDFGNLEPLKKMPNKFYEYLIILEKKMEINSEKILDLIISNSYSKTFERVNDKLKNSK